MREHGGNLDAAMERFGGTRAQWLDLSTGINPIPYPLPALAPDAWTALPDQSAQDALVAAARQFWEVPERVAILPAPGVSALIAQIPRLAPRGHVHIPQPSYNEHAASFRAAGWTLSSQEPTAKVIVHPNNPDGRIWSAADLETRLMIVDESFCDALTGTSLVSHTTRPGTLVLKSFGKFWGLAGLRLGFAIGAPDLIAALAELLGPWPVSGPALAIGAKALADRAWAERACARLAQEAERLDGIMQAKGAELVGGTPLFRLYRVASAAEMQARLARAHIWSRIFSYSETWIRLGLPPANSWDRIRKA